MNVPQRRCVTIWLTPETLCTLLLEWPRALQTGGGYIALPTLDSAYWLHDGSRLEIPQDTDLKVDDVTYSWERRAFGLRLSHPSFPVVPNSDLVPAASLMQMTLHALPVAQANVDGPLFVDMANFQRKSKQTEE